jgi:RHS repeat-associated protein
VASEDPDGDSNLFGYGLRFPGQYFDAETGLHYNYYRDGYDSATGRYTQSDPIGLRGGLNTYAYAQQNPLAYIDPSGLIGIPDLTKISDWLNPPPLSAEECRQLRDQIYWKNDLLRDELSRYNPVLDGMGGWPMAYGSGFTKPRGHYNEIRNLQKRLKKDIKRYNQRCRCDNNNDGNPPLTRNVDELANADVEEPVVPVFFVPIGDYVGVPTGVPGGVRVRIPGGMSPALAVP